MLLPCIFIFLDLFFCHLIKLFLHYFLQFFWINFINILRFFLWFSIRNLNEIFIFDFYKSMITTKILNNLIKTVIILECFNKSCHQFLLNYVKLAEIIFRFLYSLTRISILIIMFL